MNPSKRHARRGDQPLIGQLGAHFTSPKRRRLPPNKQLLVDSFAAKAKIATLKERLRAIDERSKAAKAAASGASAGGSSGTAPGVGVEQHGVPDPGVLESEQLDGPSTETHTFMPEDDVPPFTAFGPKRQPTKTKWNKIPCWCNECKGHRGLAKRTIRSHIKKNGQWDPGAQPPSLQGAPHVSILF